MRLLLSPAATKALGRMQPRRVANSILERLEAVAADPFGKHLSVKPLTGAKDAFRLRVGDWRALYRVDREVDAVLVEEIVKRGEAYR